MSMATLKNSHKIAFICNASIKLRRNKTLQHREKCNKKLLQRKKSG